jgi:hypothetical protein
VPSDHPVTLDASSRQRQSLGMVCADGFEGLSGSGAAELVAGVHPVVRTTQPARSPSM